MTATEENGGEDPKLKLIVFDFDQTLSVHHVFKSLAGWERNGSLRVPPPHATTEQGQVRRIMELDKAGVYPQTGFAAAAFGGEARVREVRRQLEALQRADIDLIVCTKGLVGPVRRILSDVGLLEFFETVYGNVEDNYGWLPYDEVTWKDEALLEPEIAEVLGDESSAGWMSKSKLIVRLMGQRRISGKEVVLVEDDPEEIRQALPFCRTVYVQQAAGMTEREFADLRRMGHVPPLVDESKAVSPAAKFNPPPRTAARAESPTDPPPPSAEEEAAAVEPSAPSAEEDAIAADPPEPSANEVASAAELPPAGADVDVSAADIPLPIADEEENTAGPPSPPAADGDDSKTDKEFSPPQRPADSSGSSTDREPNPPQRAADSSGSTTETSSPPRAVEGAGSTTKGGKLLGQKRGREEERDAWCSLM